MFNGSVIRFLPLFALFALWLSPAGRSAAADDPEGKQEGFDWRSDFAVRKSFDISLDTTGYRFPTAIAFVPRPGPAPDDPLYYVTELRGSIKAVTNDRRIIEFAKVPAFDPAVGLPYQGAEAGLAGICLEPVHGYVYITFSANDPDGSLRNHLMRYETNPETFGSVPGNRIEIAPVLSNERSAVSHQIGDCRIDGDSLYVGLGDAWRPEDSQNLDRLLGKVARMTLDGKSHPENPYGGTADPEAPRKYVWAYGLRNPFGIDLKDGRVYVAENGPNLDRFLKVSPGVNYLWNGTNWSIGTAADAVFSPAVGPVHLQHYPEGSALFPESYREYFFFSGSARFTGGIIAVPYDVASDRPNRVPFYLVKEIRNIKPSVVGLAFGPDGLYFSSLMPNKNGQTPILKLTYNADSHYPNLIGREPGKKILYEICRTCHQWEGKGGAAGPSLDGEAFIRKVGARINSDSYPGTVAEIDKIPEEPFVSTREARRAVLEAKGADKLRAYFTNKILEPRFDNPNAQMPDFGLDNRQVSQIVDLLLTGHEKKKPDSLLIRMGKQFRSRLPLPAGRKGDVGLGGIAGFVMGILVPAAVWGLRGLFR